MKREYPESQPKYAIAQSIPNAGVGRMRSPYPKADNNWYYTNESTEFLLVPYQTFRSGELPYLNGSEVGFTHGWNSFNPATDWYQAQAWVVCIQNQAGYAVGDRLLCCNRGITVIATATEIIVRVRDNGINLPRRNGNLGEFNANSARWLLYVQSVRKYDENLSF